MSAQAGSHGETQPVMVITGASSGIGRALALAAAACGYAVVAVARRGDALRALAREIGDRGGRCAIVEADVCDSAAARRIVECALASFGGLDVLVNNAGVGASGSLLAQTDAEIEAQVRLHLLAPLRLTRTALPHLRDRHGLVVFIGSGVARLPVPGFGGYCVAKAAVRAAAIQLRREVRADGIAVSYVDPGLVDTAFTETAGLRRRVSPFRHVAPEIVARRILHGIRRRAATIHGAPLHALGAVLGAWFPWVGELLIERVIDAPDTTHPRVPAPDQRPIGSPDRADVATPADAALPPEQPSMVATARASFDDALRPLGRRLERVRLPREFLASLLVPGTTVTLKDAAMQWVGMPNKNERAALAEALAALEEAGFLQRREAERWLVLRGADEPEP